MATSESGLFLYNFAKERKLKIIDTCSYGVNYRSICLLKERVLISQINTRQFIIFDLKRKKYLKIFSMENEIYQIVSFNRNLTFVLTNSKLFLLKNTELLPLKNLNFINYVILLSCRKEFAFLMTRNYFC